MAIAFVRSAKAGALTTSVTSVTVTPGASSSVGNLLIAAVMHSSSTAVITAPSGWTQQLVKQANRSLYIFTYVANPGSLASFLFSSNVSGGMSATVTEFSGVPMNAIIDVTAVNSSASGNVMDSGTTATTNLAVELWFAALGYGAGTTATISGITNSFNADQVADASSSGGTGAHLSNYYKVVSTTGTANVEATFSGGANNWLGAIITIGASAAVALGGVGGAASSGQLSASVALGGAGGASSSAQLSGASSLGGIGGALSAGQLAGAVALGGVGGGASQAQLAGAGALGGTGGALSPATLQAQVGVGGAGGASSSAQLSGAASLGGAGGAQSPGALQAQVSVGGTGGVMTAPGVIAELPVTYGPPLQATLNDAPALGATLNTPATLGATQNQQAAIGGTTRT